MRKRIVVVGSANIDMVVKSERFPEPGETLLGGEFHMLPGGKGANQAVAAARLGGDVSFMCRVGDDYFGIRSIEGYEKEEISTDYIVVDPESSTGVALISVNNTGENKIVVAPGANNQFTKKEVEQSKELFLKADIIVLQLEIPIDTIGQILKMTRENRTKVILNPAPSQPLPKWFYDDLFLISPNETEARQLSGVAIKGEDTAFKAATYFKALGVQNVIITMGRMGAFVLTEKYTGLVPAPQVKVEDTTAAGDVFNGALAVAIGQGKSVEEAVLFAIQAASLSVTRLGAQSSIPFLEEVDFLPNKVSGK